MQFLKGSLSLAALLMMPVCAIAQQRMEMEGTAIIGNKELPRVLYIVPWKSAEPVELTTPPFRSVLDEPFGTIERSSFKRELKYYQSLYPQQKQ
jgi:hypothetical protein